MRPSTWYGPLNSRPKSPWSSPWSVVKTTSTSSPQPRSATRARTRPRASSMSSTSTALRALTSRTWSAVRVAGTQSAGRLVVGHERPVVPGPPVTRLGVDDRLPGGPVLGVAGREGDLAPVDAADLGLRRVPRVVRVGEAHPAEPVVVGVERVEPVDRPVGHPVGVVDPAVDGLTFTWGAPVSPPASALTWRLSSMARQYIPRASGWLRTSHSRSGAGPWRRGWPSRGARTPDASRRGAWCPWSTAGSPRSGGRDRSRARSAPSRPVPCGSRRPQHLGDRGGVRRQRHAVHEHAVGARVLAGQDGRAGRHADHRLGVGPVEADAFRGQPVDDGGAGQRAAVAGECVESLLVGGDQEDLAAHQRAPFGASPEGARIGTAPGGCGCRTVGGHRHSSTPSTGGRWWRAARAAPAMTRARTAGSASTL